LNQISKHRMNILRLQCKNRNRRYFQTSSWEWKFAWN